LRSISDQILGGYFWPDGHVRVVGREYSAIIESRCHSVGQMSCVSCHRLHKSSTDSRPFEDWADDQLQVDMRSDLACLQCHEAQTFATAEHTHHPAGSSGSECMNCHMPNTAYGLLKATRNHTVFSPSISRDQKAGRPNACNLCHLDQSVAWSAQHMNDWYGHEVPDLERHWTNTAASVVWTLRGDAHVRALAAWHFGWEPAQAAVKSNDGFPPMLATLMNDPYDAVRYIAQKSLRTLPGYQDLKFDYVGPEVDRARGIEEVLRRWQNSSPQKGRSDLLINAGGTLDQSAFNRHLQARDTRPLHLLE
ncbi:MAG: C cytochrome precursor, partial [Limisphaerales bacterium]